MKTNKLMALIIAMVMLFSLAVPSFASGNYSSTTNKDEGGADGLDGKGTGLEWVEKKLIHIVFPTTASAQSTFDFIVDSQRLIPEVGTYYSGAVNWSGASGGVYFLISGSSGGTSPNSGTISGNVYSSTSKKLVVTSKSSHPVDIIANAKLPDESGLVAMAASSGATDSGSPLYLKLAVSSGNSGESGFVPSGSVSGSAGVFVYQTLNGVYDNFRVHDLGKGTYKYDFKPESELTAWDSTNIYLEGYVASGVKVSGTIPTIEVTWAYNDPSGMTFLGNAGVKPNDSGVVESTGVHYATGSLESGKTYYLYTPRLSSVAVCAMQSGKATSARDVSTGSSISGVTFDNSTHTIKVAAGASLTTDYIQVTNDAEDKFIVSLGAGVKEAYGDWYGSTLWINTDGANGGFSSSNLTVDLSDDGTTYKSAAGNFSVNADNLLSITWNQIQAINGGSAPSAPYYIRIIDGATTYLFKYNG